MPSASNRTEYARKLPSAPKSEAVAFLHSGGGTLKIITPQIFSREAAKTRSSDTTLNLKTEIDRIMKTDFQHLIPVFFFASSRLRVSLSNSHQSIFSQKLSMPTETNRIEYKLKLTDDLEKEVVAFLNAEGGRIHFGIGKMFLDAKFTASCLRARRRGRL